MCRTCTALLFALIGGILASVARLPELYAQSGTTYKCDLDKQYSCPCQNDRNGANESCRDGKFDAGYYIYKCVESATADCPGDFEIIVCKMRQKYDAKCTVQNANKLGVACVDSNEDTCSNKKAP